MMAILAILFWRKYENIFVFIFSSIYKYLLNVAWHVWHVWKYHCTYKFYITFHLIVSIIRTFHVQILLYTLRRENFSSILKSFEQYRITFTIDVINDRLEAIRNADEDHSVDRRVMKYNWTRRDYCLTAFTYDPPRSRRSATSSTFFVDEHLVENFASQIDCSLLRDVYCSVLIIIRAISPYILPHIDVRMRTISLVTRGVIFKYVYVYM